MLLKLLLGFSLLPSTPKAHPCPLQVLLPAVPHSLHTWLHPPAAAEQPGAAAAPKRTKFASRPGVESLLLDVHGDLVTALRGARIRSSPCSWGQGKGRGSDSSSCLYQLASCPNMGKTMISGRALGTGSTLAVFPWLGRRCTSSLLPHVHRPTESQDVRDGRGLAAHPVPPPAVHRDIFQSPGGSEPRPTLALPLWGEQLSRSGKRRPALLRAGKLRHNSRSASGPG